MGSAFLGSTLGFTELRLELLNLGFQQAILVRESSNFLILGEVLRLKGLDLLEGVFGLFLSSLGLKLEGVDFLYRSWLAKSEEQGIQFNSIQLKHLRAGGCCPDNILL